ncbi:MAG: metallophosphoesterase [Leptolyngbya sp. SIO4C1]|nr:metallophosphoesterase [Leptolyngbya sp. SIO4C1]
MSLNCRFAVVSDLHIALPHTVWDAPSRFHLVEVSIPAFEQILAALVKQEIDFLLLPGDLVQHGERENHEWLVKTLSRLPFPTYVVPGNHDIIHRDGCDRTVSLAEFTQLYQPFGYTNPEQPYYHQEILDGLHLVALNSNGFEADGTPFHHGYLDQAQLDWLDDRLAALADQLVLVMLHHNALEHLPGQARSRMGQRYMVKNAAALTQRLQAANVSLMFTGHLHVQDIAQSGGLYEITTGSLVSYPHPYRLLTLSTDAGQPQLQVASSRVEAVPDWPTLQATSRDWMGDRSFPFMMKLLTGPPLHLDPAEAELYAPKLRHFWSAIAAGDALFEFEEFPEPLQQYFRRFSAIDTEGKPRLIDNQAQLLLG